MSKVLKDAKGWLKEVDESACFCEIGETANGQPYHTLECVQTSAHIIRKLVEALEIAEQASRPTKRAVDLRYARRVPCTCGQDDGLHEWDCAISRANR